MEPTFLKDNISEAHSLKKKLENRIRLIQVIWGVVIFTFTIGMGVGMTYFMLREPDPSCTDCEMTASRVVVKRTATGEVISPMDKTFRIQQGEDITIRVEFPYSCTARKVGWKIVNGNDLIKSLSAPETTLAATKSQYQTKSKGGKARIQVSIMDQKIGQPLSPSQVIELDIQ